MTKYFGCHTTPGVLRKCEKYGCFWVLDTITTSQLEKPFKNERFQSWTLERIAGDDFKLTVTDGNDKILLERELFSTFDDAKIVFWCVDRVILLPEEY